MVPVRDLELHLDLLIVSEDELKGAQVVVLPRPWLCYQGNGRIPSGCVTTPMVVLPGEGGLIAFYCYLFV